MNVMTFANKVAGRGALNELKQHQWLMRGLKKFEEDRDLVLFDQS